MATFFSLGDTRKKQLISIGLLTFLALPVSVFFTHNFVPSKTVVTFATYASFAITFWCYLRVYRLYQADEKNIRAVWQEQSKFRKILNAIGCGLLLYAFIWINLSTAVPMIFTRLFGKDEVKLETMVKTSSAGKACHSAVTIQAVDEFFFYRCISNENYEKLPVKGFSGR